VSNNAIGPSTPDWLPTPAAGIRPCGAEPLERIDMSSPAWTFRSLAAALTFAAAVASSASRVEAQQPKPGEPKTEPKHPVHPNGPVKHPNPRPAGSPATPSIVIPPQINAMPGILATPLNQTFYNPSPYSSPFATNPLLLSPFANPLANPFANLLQNPLANPFANPFANPLQNPLANPFANPFANPLQNPLANPFANPLQKPLANPFANPFANPLQNPLANPFANTFVNINSPFTMYVPPVQYRQPGELIWRGPNLQVNPWAGTVYKPLSGTARTADGSTYFKVPGSDQYFDPVHSAFFNPTTGVITKPGGVLLPLWGR
jgi:hypothetical protein